jgi:5-methylcytosine-specific restriction endonuclease McrA
MKSKRTKALDIPKSVKDKVWERDRHSCIVCGSTNAMPNAHFISRAKSGLGIPENIVTLCQKCHHDFDNTVKREELRGYIRAYLDTHYPDFSDDMRIYKK